ncbi:Rne/Rng family ribonuclease [Desulfobulbus sp. US2]|nr:Rne/Rng family ribonuclease [Desulfobulbus sp. US4]MCW5207417.1 Rne/Rng family ribonuclease [Desulfobulbus sp. US2]WLE97094.1 MAG: Rne/Rng family ribonuclease [Candidatus Electrothrix communis]
MYTDIVINATPYENRIAVVERGSLLEFHLERPTENGLVGNIYQGKVVRVLPGMQAAFVDIGLDRTGFLYVDDIDISMSMTQLSQPEVSPSIIDAVKKNTATHLAIEDLLKEGQTILVQITKEPIGSKGARLNCHITLPCRNLVFMPLTDHIGISRKIEDEDIREELRQKIEQLRPEGTGFIVRTVAENVTAAEIEADMEFLMLLWDDIRSNAQRATAPCLIYQDLDLVLRAVRDLFTDSVNELVVDSRSMHERLLNFVVTFAPKLKSRIVYYDSEVPIFDAYGIEVDVARAIDKKVWLRSGGYLVIETTEALTVVDVNTGRYVGKNNLNETIYKTNMEAVQEISYQLRLRNIGGIIIIDFIDMEIEQHREELYNAFLKAMRKDKNRVNILKVSEFGLVQMTRKRSSESLSQLMCEPCFYCGGEGIVKSRQTICYEIFRKIYRDNRKADGKSITIKVHPHIANTLSQDEAQHLRHLEKTTGKEITVSPAYNLHVQRYEVVWDE